MSRAEDIFQKLIYFGEDAIDDFILNSQTEELFLDFKQSINIGKNGMTLHKDDRKNLAKAISGFGNSEGGVIIWGVQCNNDAEVGDVACAKVKVKNVYRFLSWIENAISGCTIPSHNRVRNHIISVDKKGDGYMATYIPKSEVAPLMTTMGSSIYIRSGSNNVPAPYSVIAGMFGRRPQPNIDVVIEEKKLEVLENAGDNMIYPETMENQPKEYVSIKFAIRGENESNVIARELYLSCMTSSFGSEHNKVRFSNYNQMDAIPSSDGQINIITKPELRLPPRGALKFANVEIVLTPDIDDDLLIDGVIGANEAAPKDFRFYASKNKLRSFVSKAIKKEENEVALVSEFFRDFFNTMV
jgi:hypothetical protein